MNINWDQIEGYREDMTAEERLELLAKYEPPQPESAETKQPEAAAEPKPGSFVSKAAFDKAASEIAALKKQLRSRMTDDEKREQERREQQEAEETMKAELEQLRRERTTSAHKASFLGLGFDEESADSAATALVDGDLDSVFALLKKQQQTAERNLRAQLLKETPRAGGSLGNEDGAQAARAQRIRAAMGLPTTP